jgi:phosphoribosylanthranilate isomerase
MTKIKLCGLRRPEDIEAANLLSPEYVGFVFAPKSRRYIPPEEAAQLRKKLLPDICAVGVFVNETPERVAALLEEGIIHMAQLHGREDETYIKMLRGLTKKPLIQAFRMDGVQAAAAAENSSADYILLDSGAGGTGLAFDWDLLSRIRRPYFLAGGLTCDTVGEAVKRYSPYGVDVSSGIETGGWKDRKKMTEFVRAVRSAAEGKM